MSGLRPAMLFAGVMSILQVGRAHAEGSLYGCEQVTSGSEATSPTDPDVSCINRLVLVAMAASAAVCLGTKRCITAGVSLTAAGYLGMSFFHSADEVSAENAALLCMWTLADLGSVFIVVAMLLQNIQGSAAVAWFLKDMKRIWVHCRPKVEKRPRVEASVEPVQVNRSAICSSDLSTTSSSASSEHGSDSPCSDSSSHSSSSTPSASSSSFSQRKLSDMSSASTDVPSSTDDDAWNSTIDDKETKGRSMSHSSVDSSSSSSVFFTKSNSRILANTPGCGIGAAKLFTRSWPRRRSSSMNSSASSTANKSTQQTQKSDVGSENSRSRAGPLMVLLAHPCSLSSSNLS